MFQLENLIREFRGLKNKKATLPESRQFRGRATRRKGTDLQVGWLLCLDAAVPWERGDGAGPEKAERS